MKKLKGSEIRQMWLDFFKSKGHEVLPSASLVPNDDPTLLWINAGVAPLKKFFDGREKPNNPRICNAQKSIRTNDIDNVGKTARHHTFFEMLGNFSIGDYFREEVLTWAYELLFSEEWFGFEKDLIYITYYPSDTDTFNKWVSLGVSPDHLIALEDNFWEIGEGPCGPDTEIFYDRGIKYDPENIGIKMLKEDIENDRYIEIWNIVFSQFNSKIGVPRSEYKELPSKNIDTGSGLERMACVMQGVETNYETDLFWPYIEYLENYTGIKYTDQMAFRVIVDHIRSVTFAISDGALLSNEGRGYVLRRILRRAVRYGRKLGIKEPFLYKMVDLVVENMKDFYPYLEEKKALVTKLIKIEEENFLKTLENGEKKLQEIIDHLDGDTISGADAFLLYDTFGFPLELTIEAASERGVNVDEEGYKLALEEQKNRARKSRNVVQSMNTQNPDFLAFTDVASFVGYETLQHESKVIGLFKDGKKTAKASGNFIVVVSETPFYAESGGQAGDQGMMYLNGEELTVLNTFKLPNGQHASVVDSGAVEVKVGDLLLLSVDADYRNDIKKNHSATHLLNQSLRNVLGSHVVQQGSQVTTNRLRFDFNHYQNLTDEEILKIEELVNKAVAHGYPVKTILTSIEEAKKAGAQALFGEKYGDVVRFVDMDYSKELCGGTHVTNTSEIGKVAIVSIESKGSGIFRVEAVSGNHVEKEVNIAVAGLIDNIKLLAEKYENLKKIALSEGFEIAFPVLPTYELTYSYQDILNKRKELEEVGNILKECEKRYEALHREKNSSNFNDFMTNSVTIDGTVYLVQKVDNMEVNVLKDVVDKISAPLEKCVIFFANVSGDKIVFVSKQKATSFNCGALVKEAAIITGGNGGGRPDFAQAGGKDASKLDEALSTIKNKLGL